MEPISLNSVLLIYGIALAAMLLFRIAPAALLRRRELPSKLKKALRLIPAAAFSALVANDIFKPELFSHDLRSAVVPVLAAVITVEAARRTRSLPKTVIVGVAAVSFFYYML